MARKARTSPAVHALAAILAASIVAAAFPHPAAACAPAPRLGEWVRVASEQAVIVWDETKKTEHFIRRASFRGSGRDFGFLVPTPTRPELAAIDDAIFDALGWATRPREITRHETSGVAIGSCFGMFLAGAERSAAPTAAAPVRVLEETRVAGYDAAVLAADDPQALATWLKERGYAEGPELAAWLAPYVAQRWIVTAFKVAPKPDPTCSPSDPGCAPAAARAVGTEAVRMTFRTERPFFPYREPEDQRRPPTQPAGAPPVDPARDLVIYAIAERRLSAAIGDGGAFPGSVPFAKRIPVPAALVPLTEGMKEPFVTVLSDTSSPRPGTDELWLSPSGEQVEVEPPPIVHVVKEPVPIPVEPVLAIAAVGGALALRRSRKRA